MRLGAILAVAQHVIKEAAFRRWLLALFGGVSLVLVVMALSLKMDVVDGALAGTQLFGELSRGDIQAVDVALRPIFKAVSFVLFYGGLCFGVLAFADLSPGLLSAGRIEHLLSLPIKRWELLFGTYLGVVSIAAVAALYSAGGFVLVMGVKTGVYLFSLLYAGALACVAFAAIYGAMLCAAVFVPSAAVSALTGLFVFFGGIAASYRDEIGAAFSSQISKQVFLGLSYVLPPIAQIAKDAAQVAIADSAFAPGLLGRVFGLCAFGLACVTVGIWRFEQRDY